MVFNEYQKLKKLKIIVGFNACVHLIPIHKKYICEFITYLFQNVESFYASDIQTNG